MILQVEKLKELSRQPDIYEKLTRSLAPNIWELDDVKRGLLCQVLNTTTYSFVVIVHQYLTFILFNMLSGDSHSFSEGMH